MLLFSRYLALAYAWVLGIGETFVFITTNKYWPLTFDDYIAVAFMLLVVRMARNELSIVLLPVGWAFVVGNFYAMLFMRLEANFNSSERLDVITVALGVGFVGLLTSIIACVQLMRKYTAQTDDNLFP
ncbi:MAG: hypothetical protein B0D91_14145 [Oceanospirillales bacterium LUC14_002_19_P2]|nr:MAG: hypothetical protein B0D91_14145 [Oceanospirillales bacterium LUC14_002_19_P2]